MGFVECALVSDLDLESNGDALSPCYTRARDLEWRVCLRQSTFGFEAQERELPNQAFQSHGTGNGGKGLLHSLGSSLVAGDVTSDGAAMETAEMKPE